MKRIVMRGKEKVRVDKIVTESIVAWSSKGSALFAVVPLQISLESADEIAHKVKKAMNIDNTSEELVALEWIE